MRSGHRSGPLKRPVVAQRSPPWGRRTAVAAMSASPYHCHMRSRLLVLTATSALLLLLAGCAGRAQSGANAPVGRTDQTSTDTAVGPDGNRPCLPIGVESTTAPTPSSICPPNPTTSPVCDVARGAPAGGVAGGSQPKSSEAPDPSESAQPPEAPRTPGCLPGTPSCGPLPLGDSGSSPPSGSGDSPSVSYPCPVVSGTPMPAGSATSGVGTVGPPSG